MTREAFIDSVQTLYDMTHRVAQNAEYIIEDIIAYKGDMDYEYLYGETDDPDWVWLGNNEHLRSIQRREDGVIIVELENDYEQRRMIDFKWLSSDDKIELADWLCRQ